MAEDPDKDRSAELEQRAWEKWSEARRPQPRTLHKTSTKSVIDEYHNKGKASSGLTDVTGLWQLGGSIRTRRSFPCERGGLCHILLARRGSRSQGARVPARLALLAERLVKTTF